MDSAGLDLEFVSATTHWGDEVGNHVMVVWYKKSRNQGAIAPGGEAAAAVTDVAGGGAKMKTGKKKGKGKVRET